MRRRQRTFHVATVLLLAVVASALLAGCGGGDSLPREAVSGTVKFDGAPLKSGTIQFQPTSAGETTAGIAPINDGKYTVKQSEGLVPGKYQVIITGILAPPEAPKNEMPGDTHPPRAPAKEVIPEKYNARSELAAQVTKEGPNTFDFDLKSK
jgi:hypothetical protein